MIQLRVRPFLLPKEGSTAAECEDAIGRNSRTMRFAVNDGATEAFDSRRWARYLTSAWVRTGRADCSADLLVQATARLGERFNRRIALKPLPWYAAEKAASGSFAAFVGVQIAADGAWTAVAVGDCCLFHERGAELLTAFPLADSESFNSRPTLVPSLPRALEQAVGSLKTRNGHLNTGDRIWLMSDALACWYLANRYGESRANSANPLASAILAGDAEITALVQREREARRLRNDDVALLYLEVIASLDGAEQ